MGKLNKIAFFVRIFLFHFRAGPKIQSKEIRIEWKAI